VTYDVSWTLDDVTADDMHALIIGIGEVASNALPPLERTVLDARNVVAYLKDDLAVPERQITLLTNQAATASAIIKALGDLAMNNDVRRGAPILIFIAAHSNRVELLTDHDGDPGFGSSVAKLDRDLPSELAKADVKLVTYDYDGEKNTGLSYAKILDILQMIAASKGDNIASYRCRLSSESEFDNINFTDPHIRYVLFRQHRYK
jgi:hypothetical protein